MTRPNPIFTVVCKYCSAVTTKFVLSDNLAKLIFADICPECYVPVVIYQEAHDRLLTIFEQTQMERAVAVVARLHYSNSQWWIDRTTCNGFPDCKHPLWHIRVV